MKLDLEQEILQNRYDILALQAMVVFLSAETVPDKWSKYWNLSHQHAGSKIKKQFPEMSHIDFSDPEATLESLRNFSKS